MKIKITYRRNLKVHVHVQIDLQRRAVADVLAQADHFRGVTDGLRGVKARKACNQLLHSMRSVAEVLADTLPPAAFAETIGAMLQEACKRITGLVVSLPALYMHETCATASQHHHHELRRVCLTPLHSQLLCQ